MSFSLASRPALGATAPTRQEVEMSGKLLSDHVDAVVVARGGSREGLANALSNLQSSLSQFLDTARIASIHVRTFPEISHGF